MEATKADHYAEDDQRIHRLLARRRTTTTERKDLIDAVQARVDRGDQDDMTSDEQRRFDALTDELKSYDERIDELVAEAERSEQIAAGTAGIRRANAGTTGGWAARATRAVTAMSENRAVVSGSVDVPTLVEKQVVANPHPERLIDLIVSRHKLPSNAYEFFRQTARTNSANVVADAATKPTSTFTVTPIEDRARVIAHLTEAVPVRLLQDHTELQRWLQSELAEGVLTALETQIISGSGSGENMRGVLNTVGLTTQAFATDVLTTLRKARTAMQILGEKPTHWVLNPADAENIDLLREEDDGQFISSYAPDSVGPASNIFGATPRLISTSVPAGTALLADWNQLRLYVRDDIRIDVDASGPDLFDKNLVKFRGEGRFGIGVLRPQAFAKVTLTGG